MKVLQMVYVGVQTKGKISGMDRKYQQMAEKALCCEISCVLQITEEDAAKLIQESLSNNITYCKQ